MLSQVLNRNMSIVSSVPSMSLLVLPGMEPQSTSNVVLALRTLGNFNFEGSYLYYIFYMCTFY